MGCVHNNKGGIAGKVQEVERGDRRRGQGTDGRGQGARQRRLERWAREDEVKDRMDRETTNESEDRTASESTRKTRVFTQTTTARFEMLSNPTR